MKFEVKIICEIEADDADAAYAAICPMLGASVVDLVINKVASDHVQ